LAHNNPKHLQRLISSLDSGSAAFFIHIDKKTDQRQFSNIRGRDVHFIAQRSAVYWGDFSVVEATLILLHQAMQGGDRFDRFVLLSGVDYPLRSAPEIERFFIDNKDIEFMNLTPLPNENAGKPMSRITTYRIRPGTLALLKMIQRISLRLRIMPRERDYRKYFCHHIPYAGSMWWALSRNACEYILNFVAKENKMVNFFKNTTVPDESFFQTIIGNSGFRAKIRRNLTYADWSGGGSSPAFLTERHLRRLRSSLSFPADDVYGAGEILFARKFSDVS